MSDEMSLGEAQRNKDQVRAFAEDYPALNYSGIQTVFTSVVASLEAALEVTKDWPAFVRTETGAEGALEHVDEFVTAIMTAAFGPHAELEVKEGESIQMTAKEGATPETLAILELLDRAMVESNNVGAPLMQMGLLLAEKREEFEPGALGETANQYISLMRRGLEGTKETLERVIPFAQILAEEQRASAN